MPRIRRATHAGSWYDASAEALREKIDGWLDAAVVSSTEDPVRAIIAPHAGHRYCGHIMAHAYKALDSTRIKRVFLLGPSHHVYSPHCLLSGLSTYSTPLGDIRIDQEVYEELLATGHFKTMPRAADEAEHSLELQMPFIAHVFRDTRVTLVPIMVGAITYESEAKYGAALAPYLDDPGNMFVISSDFCHWGQRFQFTFFDEHKGPIHKSVEWLDREGMDIIESVRIASATRTGWLLSKLGW
mmetsp:Transcript_11384/g.34219  ORF Transcript_11384/g.34219 Transcript_11384/m.34219 type:complete len:242 (-) Transcript_11384:575-1300(-)